MVLNDQRLELIGSGAMCRRYKPSQRAKCVRKHTAISISENVTLQPRSHDYRAQRLSPVVINYLNANPSGIFLRFTRKDRVLVTDTLQPERFLPMRLRFSSGWIVNGFLRNDSHADVYSIRDTNFRRPSFDHKAKFEAHVFLKEYHGNCETFAKRQKKCIRESGLCQEVFWYVGRHVFIVRVLEQKPSCVIGLSNIDFPSLVDQEVLVKRFARERTTSRRKPFYATIVGHTTAVQTAAMRKDNANSPSRTRPSSAYSLMDHISTRATDNVKSCQEQSNAIPGADCSRNAVLEASMEYVESKR